METFLLISLMAAAATATMLRPDGATLEVSSNTYYGMTYKDFRVFYQGVNERASYIPQDTCEPVTIKIFKEGDCDKQPFHTYIVPGGRKAMPGIFYFSLQNATPGRYQVQICHGETCSYRSTSLDEIPYFKEKLVCYRVLYDKTSGKEDRADDFSLDILSITGFKEDISKLPAAKNLGLTGSQNPIYKSGVLYTAFDYNISHYRPLFDTAEDIKAKEERADKGKPYTNEYCSRKYGLMVSVQLVNPSTKEIEYRFKETQYMTQKQIDLYLKNMNTDAKDSGSADNGDVGNSEGAKNETMIIPVQVVIKDDQIKPGMYTLMVAVCPTAKDILDFKVPCADSFAKENFKIGDDTEASQIVSSNPPAQAGSGSGSGQLES